MSEGAGKGRDATLAGRPREAWVVGEDRNEAIGEGLGRGVGTGWAKMGIRGQTGIGPSGEGRTGTRVGKLGQSGGGRSGWRDGGRDGLERAG